MLADPGHGAVAVTTPGSRLPRIKLRFYVSRALASDGGDARCPFAGRPVAARTLFGIERRVAASTPTLNFGERSVIGSNRQAFVSVHRSSDRPHAGMGTQAFGIVSQLPDEIALIEPRQPWRQVAIALAVQSVARGASPLRSRVAAGQREDLARCPVSGRSASIGRTGAEGGHKEQGRGQLHIRWNRLEETVVPTLMGKGVKFGMAATMAALAACKPAPDSRHQFDSQASVRGKAIIERVQCGSCHAIPGIDWPIGRLGPSLEGMDQQGLIAGALPNTPENLAAFIRNAPAVKPGTAMPAMPISNREARDIAHYLIEESKQ